MGQKVNPIGFRLGVYRRLGFSLVCAWFLCENLSLKILKIRRFIENNLSNAEISRIEIEKTGDNIRVVIHSARPGVSDW